MKLILVSSHDIETIQEDHQIYVASKGVPLILTLVADPVPAVTMKSDEPLSVWFRISDLELRPRHARMPSEFLMIYNYKTVFQDS